MRKVDPKSRETLSALLDDAADDLELRRLLRDWEELPEASREELATTWSRYNLTHSLLNGMGRPVSANLASRVSEAVARESSHRQTGVITGWQQTLARVAVAASVALAVVLGVQFSQQAPTQPPLAESPTEDADATIRSSAPTMLVDSTQPAPEPAALNAEEQGLVREYIGNIVIDPTEAAGFEQFEDSPLYRLVNDIRVED